MAEQVQTRHTRRLLLLSVASAAFVIGVSALDRAGLVPSPLRIPAALIPLVPLVWFFRVLLSWMDAMDELQRRIHLEAMAIQFAATALLVMGCGMLVRFGVLPNVSFGSAYPWLWIAMFLFWVAGITAVRRKYE